MLMVFNNTILHQYGKSIALNGSRPVANNSWVWSMCLEKLRGLQAGAEVTTTTLWAVTTRHNHTEDLSGEFVITYQDVSRGREGRLGAEQLKWLQLKSTVNKLTSLKELLSYWGSANTLRLPNIIIIIQPPPQALRFLHGRGERETSDWWWTARNHGKGLLPTFLCTHICFKRETSGYEADNN